MTTTHYLTSTDGRHTTFVTFAPLCDGLVRVMAYATHTDYTSDFIVECAEARAVWSAKIAAGFKRDRRAERDASERAEKRRAERAPGFRAAARARLAA